MVVGQMKPVKPSRSDEVLSPDEQLKIAEQVRAQFDSAAPKRPIKPSRSDPDSNPVPYSFVDQQPTIPELDKFRSLESQSPAVILSAQGDPTVEDEFVDTNYYKELNSIDKQHHTVISLFFFGKLAKWSRFKIRYFQIIYIWSIYML